MTSRSSRLFKIGRAFHFIHEGKLVKLVDHSSCWGCIIYANGTRTECSTLCIDELIKYFNFNNRELDEIIYSTGRGVPTPVWSKLKVSLFVSKYILKKSRN